MDKLNTIGFNELTKEEYAELCKIDADFCTGDDESESETENK